MIHSFHILKAKLGVQREIEEKEEKEKTENKLKIMNFALSRVSC